MTFVPPNLGMSNHALLAIGVLVLGAIVVLLLVNVISTKATVAVGLGVPFALVAAIVGLQAPLP
ncbi:MAG TPA: hypothetical protein VF897_13920, partial [Roseiflexaceae bacterium]